MDSLIQPLLYFRKKAYNSHLNSSSDALEAGSEREPVKVENNMIITGIAHSPSRLREKKEIPSLELAFLAVRALQEYQATRLVTTLAPGWEQALAKAAIELEIPYTVAVPFPRPNFFWHPDSEKLYMELLAGADEARKVKDPPVEINWRIAQANLILALWDYEFQGEVYTLVDQALRMGKKVANLWQDWEALLSLKKVYGVVYNLPKRGAQIYESRKSTL